MNITAFTSNVDTSTSAPTLPLYTLTPRPAFLSFVSDFHLSLVLPVLAYWFISAIYHVISTYNLFEEYRIHTPAALKARNRVSALEVLRAVVTQQIVQTAVGLFLGHVVFGTEEMTGRETYDVAVRALFVRRVMQRWVLPAAKVLLGLIGVDARGWSGRISDVGCLGMSYLVIFPDMALGNKSGTFGGALTLMDRGFTRWEIWVAQAIYWIFDPAVRFGIAIFFSDGWQYFWHRAMHTNKWMYRNMHSYHHRIYVPYAFGAFYNTLAEAFLLDTVGTTLSLAFAGLTTRQATVFATISVLKGVDDHCGYKLPWDPLQWLGEQNAEFHDVHHQSWGMGTNYSQLYLTFWDHACSTICRKSSEEKQRLYKKETADIEKRMRQKAEEMRAE
ncbi:MAG: sphinganine hydroxylase [Lasallia pustulata]|uniref:Sphinganine hydroxylase n=1 Tax=Lasallia pustulata TaxID=136370 RepID=A0A5M8PYS8_9LECA|nr:MAG: sphinganine hydroxylase [Lasallia pustulata]